MASDDNPFGRASAWPKMPQAPFRIGPLAKAAPASPSPAPEAEPEPGRPGAITPLYVRPAEAAAPTVLAVGRVAPRAERPAIPPPQSPRPTTPPPKPAPPEAPELGRELEAVIVQPVARPVGPARRRSAPLIGAGLVGIAGLATLAVVLLPGRRAEPPPTSPDPVAVAPASPEPAVASPAAPLPAAVEAAPPAGAEPVRPEAPTARLAGRIPAAPAPAPTRVASAPRPAPPPRAETPPPQPAAAAVEAAITAPVLDLPKPAPLPAYTPPAAPDPNAPMTTRRPY